MPARRLLLALTLALAGPAVAQTCTTSWTNAAGGAWETDTNWSSGVPEAGDVACVTLDGTYTVAQSRTDRTVAGLVVGGASGTQTLTTFNAFGITGDAVVRPNGRWEVLNRTPGGGDGVYSTGTVLVEGVIVQNGGTSFLTTGGLLDIAPGGTYRLVTNAGAGGASATFRIRGLLDAADCGGTCGVSALLDVQGGTLRASVGVLALSGGGTYHNATLDAVAGASLNFRRPGTHTLTGTLAGAPAGRVSVQDGVFRAGPSDATLALGGAGLVFDGSSGTQFSTITSAGGRFVNTGLLIWEDSFAIASGVVIENRGTLRNLEGVSLADGARLLNRAGATWELATSSGMGFGTGTAENAGLIVKTGAGSTGFGGRLRNLPGAEMRALNGRLDLAAPASQMLPDGVTVTGTAEVLFPSALEIEGAVSPGTEAQPVDTLVAGATYRVSLVAGSPRLVIDVDAGGVSDRLAISAGGGTPNIPRLGGALIVRVRPGYTPAVGDAWTVLTSTRAVTGQFTQVVAEGAPSGIAFVAEIPADGLSVVVRAVETAPGGPVTVSTTTPVGGGVRSIFLTGPGAPGVSGARLDCVECLDPEAYGTIPASVVGEGTLKEARFDLTSPRAFGRYTLVIQRPSQPDEAVPVTVRPYVSYVRSLPSLVRGMRVRPPRTGYNWSHYDLTNVTNVDAPGYPFTFVLPENPDLVSFAVATGTPFSTGVVFYENETAPNREDPAFLFSRIPANETAPLSTGQRIAPADVLFPEQTPTGPDDSRIPFGEDRVLTVTSVQHTSFGRAVGIIEAALRNAQSESLRSYLASVDAASALAVRRAIEDALTTRPRYAAGIPDLLRQTLARMNATVTTPTGLAASAGTAFERTLEAAVYRHYADVEYAYRIDLAEAPEAVQDLLTAEYEALLAASSARLGDTSSQLGGLVCPDLNRLKRSLPQRPPPPPTEVDIDAVIQTQVQEENTPPPPTEIDITVIRAETDRNKSLTNILQAVGETTKQVIQNIERRLVAGGEAGSGLGGVGGCGPPQAPADPNDKIPDVSLRCEIGTVTVGDEEQTRCVRSFIPVVRAGAPVLYSVQFENLPEATANAEFVTITDTLDASLNPSTLRVIATSSDSTFSYATSGQVVTFRFVGIDLPPNVTEPEGQGFITYEVTPRAGLSEGTVIENTASIVFDFNPPIGTPTVVHEIRASSDVAVALDAPDFVTAGGPLSFDVVVSNVDGDAAGDVSVTIGAGAAIASATPSAGTCAGSGPVTCSLGTLAGGTYERVSVTLAVPPLGEYVLSASATTTAFDPFAPNNTDARTAGVVGVGTEADADLPREVTLVSPYPNPARGAVTFRWGLPAPGGVDLRVYDLLGREVARLGDGAEAASGWHETRWVPDVAAGVYVVRLQTEAAGRVETRTRRLTVLR